MSDERESSSLFEDSDEDYAPLSPSKSSWRNVSTTGRGLKRAAREAYESPSKKSRVLSAKELEILRRQRQVAAQISLNSMDKNKKGELIQHSHTSTSSNQTLLNQAALTNPQQKLLQKAKQKQILQQILKPSVAVKRSPSNPNQNTNSATIDLVSYDDVHPNKIVSSHALTRKHIRPSQRPTKQLHSPPTSAADALAAARNRLNLSSKNHSNPETKSKVPNKTTTTLSATNASNTMSKTTHIRATMKKRLLPSSNKTNSSLASPDNKNVFKDFYRRVEAEDYWRMIRDWDFLNALNLRIKSQQNRSSKPNNNTDKKSKENPSSSSRGYDNKDSSSTKSSIPNSRDSSKKQQDDETISSSSLKAMTPIPDFFDSPQQYKALWAPLCLQEAAAQMLSEFTGSYGAVSRCKNPLKVVVSPLKKDIGGKSDYITVQIRVPDSRGGRRGNASNGRDGGSNDTTFMTNDIVILTNESLVTQSALKGQLKNTSDSNFDVSDNDSNSLVFPELEPNAKRLGLLGQVEQFKRSPDGLCLKISRKLWKGVGASEMYLVKIGSNVTALREFVALCRTDKIPLIHDILCDKKRTEGSHDDVKHGQTSTSSKEKNNLLANMGGVEALGKGFTKYAIKKYNQSQLGAISAAAKGYGEGGFTLVKGPPGTGKTTTLVALLNSLHIRQFNKYYNEVGKIAAIFDAGDSAKTTIALESAAKNKPRLLVCAPSNAAVDNVILKIMADGFVDGNGHRYNPSMVRIGVGQSAAVKDIALEAKVNSFLAEGSDLAQLDTSIAGYRVELLRLQKDIAKLRRRIQALTVACPWPLSREWEIRIDEETFDRTGRIYFVNHKQKRTSYQIPPEAKPGEQQYTATSMPEYRTHLGTIVKLVERYNTISSKLQRTKLVQTVSESLAKGYNGNSQSVSNVRQQLETQIIDSVHIVLTTLGTAGSRTLESAEKFEVVVIDEAAQSVEPATLVALQLGSSHAILVGDPQQLPATIFSVSGRSTKYDRSLFQRLEEANYPVHMLDTQYRMHPCISDFPRRIFYDGNLLDGPNVKDPEYGNPLYRTIISKLPNFQPFTILDLDSSEERGGTSLSNSSEAKLALHLYNTLARKTNGLASKSRVAIITPYAQQAALLRRTFSQCFGEEYQKRVEVNTVDAFQGRESNIVIFSCVRAAGSKGIGFLSDVRRMNVALTRAKHFLFVIARCSSIIVNPYWRDLVNNAKENKAVIKVPLLRQQSFPDLESLPPEPPPRKKLVSVAEAKKSKEVNNDKNDDSSEDGEVEALFV